MGGYMQLTRYLAAIGLSLLLAAPVAAQTTSPSKSPSSPAAAKPDTTSKSPAATGSQAPGSLVDINSASAEELDKLPGIGPARVKAIIANRPYSGKDDLSQRKVIPPNVYNQIKDKIIARQGTTTK
jgi:competence protein ComEA